MFPPLYKKIYYSLRDLRESSACFIEKYSDEFVRKSFTLRTITTYKSILWALMSARAFLIHRLLLQLPYYHIQCLLVAPVVKSKMAIQLKYFTLTSLNHIDRYLIKGGSVLNVSWTWLQDNLLPRRYLFYSSFILLPLDLQADSDCFSYLYNEIERGYFFVENLLREFRPIIACNMTHCSVNVC